MILHSPRFPIAFASEPGILSPTCFLMNQIRLPIRRHRNPNLRRSDRVVRSVPSPGAGDRSPPDRSRTLPKQRPPCWRRLRPFPLLLRWSPICSTRRGPNPLPGGNHSLLCPRENPPGKRPLPEDEPSWPKPLRMSPESCRHFVKCSMIWTISLKFSRKRSGKKLETSTKFEFCASACSSFHVPKGENPRPHRHLTNRIRSTGMSRHSSPWQQLPSKTSTRASKSKLVPGSNSNSEDHTPTGSNPAIHSTQIAGDPPDRNVSQEKGARTPPPVNLSTSSRQLLNHRRAGPNLQRHSGRKRHSRFAANFDFSPGKIALFRQGFRPGLQQKALRQFALSDQSQT
jgi:hypothetical protein